jgi:multisubunit Na+/H+ antiporter MnhB subunit
MQPGHSVLTITSAVSNYKIILVMVLYSSASRLPDGGLSSSLLIAAMLIFLLLQAAEAEKHEQTGVLKDTGSLLQRF